MCATRRATTCVCVWCAWDLFSEPHLQGWLTRTRSASEQHFLRAVPLGDPLCPSCLLSNHSSKLEQHGYNMP